MALVTSDDGHEMEFKDLFGRFTIDIIGTCAFGIECNSLKDPQAKFLQMGRLTTEAPRHPTWFWIIMSQPHLRIGADGYD